MPCPLPSGPAGPPTAATSRDFRTPTGSDLLGRTVPFAEWQDALRRRGMHPFSRGLDGPPSEPEARLRSADGRLEPGINLASQDPLGLASHHAVREAAVRALAELGLHSAGSPCLTGNTRLSLAVEQAVGELLGAEQVLLFPSGWAAGFGAIVGLVRERDHVVLDRFAPAALQHGARAATPNVVRYAHLDVGDARERLAAIRSRDATGAILVASAALFPATSDSPDLARLESACREHDATLLVDVTHDLGALGPHGTGVVGRQRMLGKVDLLVGSFASTFAANGGFLATGSASVKEYVKWFGGSHGFSSASSPLQSGVVLEALRLVRSEEGDDLRARLATNARVLRDALARDGHVPLGEPSPLVPVPIGSEARARVVPALLAARGVLADVVEYPAVPRDAARLWLRIMATHRPDRLAEAARTIAEVLDQAERIPADGTGA